MFPSLESIYGSVSRKRLIFNRYYIAKRPIFINLYRVNRSNRYSASNSKLFWTRNQSIAWLRAVLRTDNLLFHLFNNSRCSLLITNSRRAAYLLRPWQRPPRTTSLTYRHHLPTGPLRRHLAVNWTGWATTSSLCCGPSAHAQMIGWYIHLIIWIRLACSCSLRKCISLDPIISQRQVVSIRNTITAWLAHRKGSAAHSACNQTYPRSLGRAALPTPEWIPTARDFCAKQTINI